MRVHVRCTCIHTCMHTYIHTYIHIYIHIYIYTYIHIYIYTSTSTYRYTHICIHASVHIMRTYIHAGVLGRTFKLDPTVRGFPSRGYKGCLASFEVYIRTIQEAPTRCDPEFTHARLLLKSICSQPALTPLMTCSNRGGRSPRPAKPRFGSCGGVALLT